MRLSLACTVILFIAEQITLVHSLGRILPKPILDVSRVYRHREYIDQKVRRDAHAILNHALYHQRDVIPSPSTTDVPAAATSPAANSQASDKPGDWNKETEAACLDALSKMSDTPPNDSGMAACYNIRYFNKSTGTFQADLRLYRMALPTGDWASLNSPGMSIRLSCSGASLAVGDSKKAKRNGEMLSWPPIGRAARRAITLRRSPSPSPQKLQDLTIVGKVHDDQMGAINNQASARSLLFPTINLSGTANSGQTLHSEVSSEDATFISGVLSDNAAKAASSPAAATAASGAEAQGHDFVLPGKTFGIFPVGFVITGVWAFVFVAVVGAGTVDRIRFREAYRRRVKREMSVGLRMI